MPPKAPKATKTAKPAKPVKNKTKRGPSAPSAYILFCKEKRPEVQTANPTASFGEMGKLLGELWAKMSDAEKLVTVLYLIITTLIFSLMISTFFQTNSRLRRSQTKQRLH
jgi:hypothetical protein